MAVYLDSTHLKEGDTAPKFEVLDQDGKTIRLEDYEGKKLVLYFYPRDNTPTCTVEACNLRDNYLDFKAKGFEILGVSPDTRRKHQNFIKKFSLPFSLLMDTDKKLINLYGVWGRKIFMGREIEGVLRTTFVISEKGQIERIFNKVKSKQHTEQIFGSFEVGEKS